MDSNKGQWVELENGKFVKKLTPKIYSVALLRKIFNANNRIQFYELSYKTIDFSNREINAELAIEYVESLPVNQLEQYYKISDRFRINQILDSLGVTKYIRKKRLKPIGSYLENAFSEMD